MISPEAGGPRLRVAVIYPDKDPLSPQSWSGTPRGIAEGLAASGAEVVPIGQFLPPGISQVEKVVARLGGRRGAVADRAPSRMRARVWTFQRQLDRGGPFDLVVAMGTDCYDLGAISVPCPIVTYDDGTLEQMWRNEDSDIRNAGFPPSEVERWIATQRASTAAAAVACVSTAWAARSVVADYGIDASRVHAVGMGHRPRSGSAEERDWAHPVFLFVGIDWERKNGTRVLAAFRQIAAERPDAVLHLVGRHEPVTEPNVVDHGLLRRDDPDAQLLLDRLFASSTAFVLPSRFDPSPIAYLEAASAGLPVIATTEGGAGELLREAAITVAPDDQEGLVAAMRALCDGTTASSMGAAGREVASSSTWNHVAARILASAGLSAPAEVDVREAR